MYSQITSNKRKTWLLIIIACSIVMLLSVVFGAANGVDVYSSIIMGTVFGSIYALISYYFSAKTALWSTGAKEIKKAQAPEIWNIVENLCIANGQPMPKVYIIDDPSPNAFATGRDPNHAAIAFTTGILSILNKQELEGVAAHELSHVKNYDIRVMTIVVVLVGAIMLFADLFIHLRPRDKDSGQAAIVFLIVGLALSILSPILAEIIKLAVSRQREYLADASAALLTRYPDGLASALEKIHSANVPMKDASHATAHLFISNPFGAKQTRSFFSSLFSTHPPVEERVKRLRNMGG